jgi:hypothetical protein
MSDNLAPARAREAGDRWLTGTLGNATPEVIGQMAWDRDGLIDLFAAGAAWAVEQCGTIHREEQDQWHEERRIGQQQLDDATALMREAVELFREYEAHHAAKASEAGRPEKAVRNALMAERLEAWLRGDGQYPVSLSPGGTLTYATAIKDTPGGGQERVALRGLDPREFTPVPGFGDNPAEVLRGIAEETAQQLGLEVDHPAFDQAAAQLDDLVFPEAEEGVPILIEGEGLEARPVERLWTEGGGPPFGDEACRYVPGEDTVVAHGEATDGRTLEDCRAKFPTEPFTGFDPEVLAAMRAAAGNPDPEPFRVITGDPRFDPKEPVTINGYLYHPATKED